MINKAQAIGLKVGDLVEHTRLLDNHTTKVSLMRGKVISLCETSPYLRTWFNLRVQTNDKIYTITALTGVYWNIVKEK